MTFATRGEQFVTFACIVYTPCYKTHVVGKTKWVRSKLASCVVVAIPRGIYVYENGVAAVNEQRGTSLTSLLIIDPLKYIRRESCVYWLVKKYTDEKAHVLEIMPTNGSVKFGMYEYEVFFLFRISCNALYKARNKVREKGDKQSVKLVITSLILLMIGFVVIIAMMLERKEMYRSDRFTWKKWAF